jgi:RalA-binding protein 1
MALHRPHLVRWSQFLEESLTILQTSPDAAPTDPYLCHLVRTNKLGEEIGTQFSFDEPIMTLNLADARSQVILRRFERELEKHKSEVPKELMQRTVDYPCLLLIVTRRQELTCVSLFSYPNH